MLAARAASGQTLGRPTADDRSRVSRRRSVQSQPSMIGPESAAAAAKPPLLTFSLFLSFIQPRLILMPVARQATPGWPDLHLTHARRRWRPPTAAQAQRGGEHAEPMREPNRLPPRRPDGGPGRRRSVQSQPPPRPSLPFSLSPSFSLSFNRGSFLCRWHDRPPPAGQTSTGRTPGAGGGHRPPPRLDEVASTLNQRGSRTGSRPEGGPPDPLLSLSLPYPVPHRMPSPMPVGPLAKAQARRGDRHAAGPEPRSTWEEDAMASSSPMAPS